MLAARPLRHLAFSSIVSISVFACGGDDGAGTGDSATDTGSDEQSPESGETGEEEDDPNLLAIPGGTFEMGCSPSNAPCDPDNPPHEVTISAFKMEATEVTVAAYTECVDAGACSEASGTDCNYGVITMAEHPINCVTWQQAADYCAWKGRRLPTEAEWEYAATGGTDRPYPWGSAAASCDVAHMYQQVEQMGDYGCLTGITAPVGSYPNGASPFGLLDMAGNVEEWVADWYAEGYYTSGPTTDPQGPSDGTQRVHRGGDLYDASSLNLRVFERWRSEPTLAVPERGFRCAQ